MDSISKRQREILNYIEEKINASGVAPSVREIGEAVGLRSTSSVQYNLDALEAAGYIVRDANLKRTLRLAGSNQSISRVPLLGTVTAGMPILATQLVEDYISVAGIGSGKHFALRIKGESMINAGIFDGDIVVVEQCPSADNGEIVVALVGEEATVKRFYKEDGHFRLQPENDRLDPIIVEECTILGKVKMLIRSY